MRVETGRRIQNRNGDGNGDGSEESGGDGNGDEDNGNGTRIGSETVEKRRRSARNRKIVVDAMCETGETWLDGKRENVEKKGLVQ